jgi:AcrR family transcriptional regulator
MSRPVQLDPRPPVATLDDQAPPLKPSALTEQLIVDAAREIVAESGTESLTARALSDRLGVSLGSTYHHVRGRDALLTLVTQDLYRSINIPDPSSRHWRAYVRELMIRVADVFSRHPGMVAFNVTHPDETHPTAVGDTLRSVLHQAGFTEESAQALMAALFFYVNGFLQGGMAAWLADAASGSRNQIFVNALDLVLDGAEVQLQKAALA